MKESNRLSGNILFGKVDKITTESVLKISLTKTDGNTSTVEAEREIKLDVDELKVFKYLSFEFRDFDLQPNYDYSILACVKNANNEDDYISDNYSIFTGLENLTIEMHGCSRVKVVNGF